MVLVVGGGGVLVTNGRKSGIKCIQGSRKFRQWGVLIFIFVINVFVWTSLNEAMGPNPRGLEPQGSILCREYIVALQCYPSIDHQKVFIIHLSFPSCLELIEDKQETWQCILEVLF